MPELRKRKAVEPTTKSSPKKLNSGSTLEKIKPVNSPPDPAARSVTVGDTLDFAGFGAEIAMNDGQAATLSSLVQRSAEGVILFTYPKASTPGCTTQACLFRDNYEDLTANGFAIYGLSRDSPKANTTFQTKQNLPFPLLCDPKGQLISAIGLEKPPNGTTRGVFVLNKAGKVLALEPGGPAATLEKVRRLFKHQMPAAWVEDGGPSNAAGRSSNGADGVDDTSTATAKDNQARADVAAQVADTASKLDQ